jgi:hypothetical protein
LLLVIGTPDATEVWAKATYCRRSRSASLGHVRLPELTRGKTQTRVQDRALHSLSRVAPAGPLKVILRRRSFWSEGRAGRSTGAHGEDTMTIRRQRHLVGAMLLNH